MQSIISFIKSHKIKVGIGALAVVIIVSGLARGGEPSQEAVAQHKSVEILTVEDINSGSSTLPLVGELQSVDQIDLRPQLAGQVARVHVGIGDLVTPGQLLVELEHADLDASVSQASASLQSALANYEKLRNGARPEDLVIAEQNLAIAQQTLDDMKNGARPEEVAIARANVSNAESAVEDARVNYDLTQEQNDVALENVLDSASLARQQAKIDFDKIFTSDLQGLYTPFPYELTVSSTSFEDRSDLGSDRGTIELAFNNWFDSEPTWSVTNYEPLLNDLNQGETHLRYLLDYTGRLIEYLDGAIASNVITETQIQTYRLNATNARTTFKNSLDSFSGFEQSVLNQVVANKKALEASQTQIDSALTNLTNMREQFDIAQQGASVEQIAIQEAAVKQAEQQVLIAKNGARPEDLALQQASIAQAQAALALATAQRDKAFVKAPIAGTVTYLPVEISDFISSSTIAVSVANKEALQVETFVSEQERRFLAVGNEAMIADSIKGSITSIAPALDPLTKKIEVIIALEQADETLTIGETVRLDVQKSEAVQAALIPLSAVRVKSTGAEMYFVNQEGTIESLSVEIGNVLGTSVEVMTTLDPGLQIIKDVRGLRPGQTVTIK